MSGFTLYETLRIFLPGALAVAIANLSLRLSNQTGWLEVQGRGEALIEILEHPGAFALLAVVAGLLLYLIDLPSRLRIHREGDPEHGFGIPSEHLAGMVEGSPALTNRALSLYFLVTDTYLHPEAHRKVYLFGSLYRVYVDLRVLLALGVVAAGTATIARFRTPDDLAVWPGRHSWVFWAGVVGVLMTGANGVLSHRLRFKRRRVTESQSEEAGSDASAGVRRFREAVWQDLRSIRWVLVLILLLEVLGAASMTVFPGAAPVGALLVFGAFLLWVSVEVGPPVPTESAEASAFRSRLMVLLGARGDGSQFSPIQRLLADCCLLLPLFAMVTSVLVSERGAASDLAGWMILILPCVAVGSFRKHEIRLLSTYRDQVTWLELNRKRIEAVAKSGELPRQW